ncbi:hypothetical protein [Methanosarcina sp. WH1]|uniref:hypothetical protein n=1 Tax=Methanosarcina sp. WH1 TaxID=1434102 RepID=UPI000B2457EE|nr:hypothetical protein [Methanosarcina sp. WH1]
MVGKHSGQGCLIFKQAVEHTCRKGVKGVIGSGKDREGPFPLRFSSGPAVFMVVIRVVKKPASSAV